MTINEVIQLLGIAWCYPTLKPISRSLHGTIYRFMGTNEYVQLASADPAAGMRIYWMELVGRIHLAGATAFLRQERWLQAMVSAACGSNYLAFAAAFRGLLESAADIYDSLNGVPTMLLTNRPMIEKALKGELSERVESQDLENKLLHYSHARKPLPNEPRPPDAQIAKQSRICITRLQGSPSGALHDCYAELCNIAHPAALSVLAFLQPTSDEELHLRADLDPDQIRALTLTHAEALSISIEAGLNLAVMLLACLNNLRHHDSVTPIISTLDLSNIGLWKTIGPALEAR